MKLQTNWNYETSVQKVSGLVSELKSVTLKKSTLTDAIARELYEAREQLSNSGYRSDLVPNGTRFTWLGFLSDVGLAKSTVHRWLEHYEPEEQRLLTDEEYQAKQEEKRSGRTDLAYVCELPKTKLEKQYVKIIHKNYRQKHFIVI